MILNWDDLANTFKISREQIQDALDRLYMTTVQLPAKLSFSKFG